MEFKVRPFATLVQTIEDEPPTKCQGAIVGQEYQLQFGAGLHRLPALRVESDEVGPFAVLEPTRNAIEYGFVLIVEAENPGSLMAEDGGGCCVGLEHSRDPDQVRAWLASQGLDPDQFNLVVPPDFGITIYFDSSGASSGTSSTATVKKRQQKGSVH